jgi:hypothetical protein
LLDNGNHHTHFTGFLLEEEIFDSLWGSTSSATHETFSTQTVLLTRNFEEERNFKGGGVGRKFVRLLIQ